MAEAVFTSFEIELYRLETITPLPVATTKMICRDGALIRACFDVAGTEVCVLGDVAPLVGFNRETLRSSIEVAQRHLERWIDQALPLIDLDRGLSEVWEAFVEPTPDHPALSWALFQIAATFHHRAQGLSLDAVFGEKLNAKTYYLDTGGGKYKVTRSEDLPRSDEPVRLDSNRTLRFDDALALAEAGRDLTIVYWEEPLEDITRLREFRDKTGISIGLDETLADDRWRSFPCDCYVIKPTVLGWRRTKEVVEHAHANDVRCVISTAYESAIGRRFLRSFATSIDAELGLGHPELFINDFDQNDAVSNV